MKIFALQKWDNLHDVTLQIGMGKVPSGFIIDNF